MLLLIEPALPQGHLVGTTPPKLQGQTLNDKPIALPDDAAGRITLLVLSLSRKAGERTVPWREHFAADFGNDPNITYYTTALLEGAPSLLRGMIRSGIRKGTPATAYSHVLTSNTEEEPWRRYLALKDDSLPAVLLLDAASRVRWSYFGVYDPQRYGDLKAIAQKTKAENQ
jgi:hypothetical protein